MVQTCIRYAEDQRCRFCTIEESLREGATIAAKTPAQLAEVAEAAVGLDGVTQMVMTTGTTTGPAHPGPSPACGRLAARGSLYLGGRGRAAPAVLPDPAGQHRCPLTRSADPLNRSGCHDRRRGTRQL